MGGDGLQKSENLISLAERPPAQRREIARLGGIASGAARRKKRTFRQVFAALLPRAVAREELGDLARLAGDLGPVSAQEAIALALMAKAMKGDTAAFTAIRDTLGEKPGQQAPAAGAAVTLTLAPELAEDAQ